jgi:PAS domain S-box-containing protein
MRKLGPRALGAYAALRARIIAGEWPPESRLPGQIALAGLLQVAPLTLRQALDRLEAEGMISRESRRGMYVRSTDIAGILELEDMFDTLFQHAPIGISLLNNAGCLLRSNPALQELLGYSAAELQGKCIPEYTHPDDIPLHVEAVARSISERRRYFDLEKRYVRKDGNVVSCRLLVYSIVREHEEVGAIALVEPLG